MRITETNLCLKIFYSIMKIKVNIDDDLLSVREIVNQSEATEFARINYPNLVCNECDDGAFYQEDNQNYRCFNCGHRTTIHQIDPDTPFEPVNYKD